jgi:putative hemolysin
MSGLELGRPEVDLAGSRIAWVDGFGGLDGRREPLASAGSLEVLLATSDPQIRAAQELRYRVFFENGAAIPDRAARLTRRDICPFDEVCDHLIVIDKAARADGAPVIVGAYRLLRQEVAEQRFGFYSAKEFQVEALIARHPEKRFLELGRSCVAEGYRGKRTLELLWRGIWAYALRLRVDVMFGCASLPGTDPDAHASALGYLREERGDESTWAVDAVADGIVTRPIGQDVLVEPRSALRALPPLLKGYLRLGARFSREAVVDVAFGTTDVLVVLPIEEITARYLSYFAPDDAAGPMAA